MEEISQELTNIDFYKLNIDNNNQLSQEFNVRYIPTYIVIEEASYALPKFLVGSQDKSALKQFIET